MLTKPSPTLESRFWSFKMTEIFIPEKVEEAAPVELIEGVELDVCRLPGWAEVNENGSHQTSVHDLPLDEVLED